MRSGGAQVSRRARRGLKSPMECSIGSRLRAGVLSARNGGQPRARVVSFCQESLERDQRSRKRSKARRVRRPNVAAITRRAGGGNAVRLAFGGGRPLHLRWLVLKLEELRHSHSLCSQVRNHLDCRARTGSLFAPPSPSDHIRAGDQRFPRDSNLDMGKRRCQAVVHMASQIPWSTSPYPSSDRGTPQNRTARRSSNEQVTPALSTESPRSTQLAAGSSRLRTLLKVSKGKNPSITGLSAGPALRVVVHRAAPSCLPTRARSRPPQLLTWHPAPLASARNGVQGS